MLISVIVPVYNVAAYLDRSVKSLLEQTYQDLQIILVDDGSTDESGALCDAYGEKDPRIQVIHKVNEGLAETRNAGIQVAEGEFITFMDSDDWLEPDTYEKIVKILEVHDPDVLQFGLQKVCDGKKIKDCMPMQKEGFYQGEKLREIRLDTIYQEGVLDHAVSKNLSACTIVCKASWLRKNSLKFISEKEILNEDYLFVLQAIWRAGSVYILRQALYSYDTRPGSITTSPRCFMYEKKQRLFEKYEESVDCQDPEAVIRLKNFYIDCLYDSVTNECKLKQSVWKSWKRIRSLLKDEKLQKYLRENKDRIQKKKPKVVCFMMKHHMALGIYLGYRQILRGKKRGMVHGKN